MTKNELALEAVKALKEQVTEKKLGISCFNELMIAIEAGLNDQSGS